MMIDFVLFVAAVGVGLLVADFASGLIHWIIDRYCSPVFPIAGPHFFGLIHEHHRRPLAMLRLGVVRNNAGFVTLVGALFGLFWLLHWLNPVTLSAFFFGAFANQIHQWAHRRPKFGGSLVAVLQAWGVLQSPHHHGVHHGPTPTAHYCLITNFVNPVVDEMRLWQWGEGVLALVGIRPQLYVEPNLFYVLSVGDR